MDPSYLEEITNKLFGPVDMEVIIRAHAEMMAAVKAQFAKVDELSYQRPLPPTILQELFNIDREIIDIQNSFIATHVIHMMMYIQGVQTIVNHGINNS